jgi:hypothetical protein
MSTRTGFTVPELLVAGALLLIVTLGVLTLVDPGHSSATARAAGIDIRQRLRAASEMIGSDLAAAGSGPPNGAFGRAVGTVAASVFPCRLGSGGDPPGTVRADALTIMSSAANHVAASLSADWLPSTGATADIALGPGCPAGDPSCGFGAGTAVLLVDGRGQSDLYRITSVSGTGLTLASLGTSSGRAFPAGSLVVPVVVSTYYSKAGTSSQGDTLMAGDGDQSDLPLADHITHMAFELLGEPRPPALRSAVTQHPATYGPSPPGLTEDNPRDAWGVGENCAFQVSGTAQVPRLVPLASGSGLVVLAASVLTDGPWCPDAAAANRYDADLLRVRAVRVTIRAEASRLAARGSDTALFLHPGSSRDRSAAAADQEVVFDVVPRALQVGR